MLCYTFQVLQDIGRDDPAGFEGEAESPTLQWTVGLPSR